LAAPTLPFWLVTEHNHVLSSPANIPCADPSAVHAFTSAEKLTAFLAARVGGRWEIRPVADYAGVVVAVADLHKHGAPHLCIDLAPDGSGGDLITLAELLDAYTR
jgi:hypothetical protein